MSSNILMSFESINLLAKNSCGTVVFYITVPKIKIIICLAKRMFMAM